MLDKGERELYNAHIMPELPEVETICREILPYVKGRKIESFEIIDHRNIKGISPDLLKKKLAGQKIKDVKRLAKYILFPLENGTCLVVHLGMTGRLLFKPDKYVKVVFHLSEKHPLYFSDARLFGKIRFYETEPKLNLGPEPLTPKFTLQQFNEMLSKRKTSIKLVLLDQKLISGVGNIYANEALFRAGILPGRASNSLSVAEVKKLHKKIEEVLAEAIKYRGTSDSWYVDAKGEKGGFQNRLRVYGKKGEPCGKCGTHVERVSMGQRGTYFCPECQK